MRIVISGATETGMLFVQRMVKDHDLRVIESDHKRLKQLEQYDLETLQGNPTTLVTLNQAELAKADLFIACTDSDEVNIISCLAVKQIAKIYTICLVSKPHYFETFTGELGANLAINKIVWPQKALGEHIAKVIRVPGAIDVKVFEHEDLRLLEFKIKAEDPSIDKTLQELNTPKGALAVALFRDESVIIPSGNTIIKESDKLMFMGHATAMRKIEDRFNPRLGKPLNIVIVGGGNTAFALAKALEPFKSIKIRIIESQNKVSHFLADRLSDRIIVLNADGADPEYLKRQNLNDCDCLVALTGSDERNLLISIHAKELGAKKIIARVHSVGNIPIFEKMGVDLTLSAQFNALNEVCRQILRENRDVLAFFEGGRAEIKEVEVSEHFKANTIIDLKLPKGIIIAAIKRGGQTIVPSGENKIKPGDKLRVFCAENKAAVLEQFIHKFDD